MSIRFAVLGLLRDQAMHGYAVRAAFEQQLGDFWELNYGQVYQVLTALEAEGLITGRDEQVGKRPLRRVFSISPKGREAFQVWLTKPAVGLRPFRDDLYVRLLFAESDSELVSDLLHQQLVLCQEHLAALVAERDACKRDGQSSQIRMLFTEAAILRVEAELAALRRCEATLLSTSAARAVEGTDRKCARRTRPAARA